MPPLQFRFEPDLDYQQAAIAAVCDLFRGQESGRSEFALPPPPEESGRLGLAENARGLGNRLNLSPDSLLANLREVQRRHGLRPADHLESPDFTVEMETGTGKTYVYLRTIFELNRQYGFAKFAIVVPSIAIKEGVNKSLAMMGDHFRGLYAGVPFEHFLYDSAQLGQVRNFAASPHLQIMVVTVGAINKRDLNSIYQANEKTGGEKPIDLVRATHPILIVDEPQSVEGGLTGQGRAALQAMNPLATLRYSATPVNEYHMVYRLNAVDAYQRQLVKQIEVAAATTLDDYNRPYVRLLSLRRRRNAITAQVEVDVAAAAGRVHRRALTVQDGDDLERKTGRPLYAGCRIGEIQAAGRGREYLLLRTPGGEQWLTPGQAWGAADSQALPRLMLREAIRQHLDKQLRLQPQGIKVLTLFFIDSVAKYRTYAADGHPMPGEYARIFEEEYRRAAGHPDYRQLFEGVDLATAIEPIHNGYFSLDRRGRWSETAENNQENRDNTERAYRLIMREKERLLSLAEPLQFIFSHSALREGWDNPNIFQICALRDIASEPARRQAIGRGLRLCVNQQGERQQGFELNTLTVIARESYEEFAENLQREMEQETGIQFGVVSRDYFAGLPWQDDRDPGAVLGVELSETLWHHLNIQGYLDANGKIEDALRVALADDSLKLSAEFEPLRAAILARLRQADRRIEIKKAEERRPVRPNPKVLDSPAFRELWARIQDKTTYQVRFDGADLIENCAAALREAPHLSPARLQWQTARLDLGPAGVSGQIQEEGAILTLAADNLELPDLLAQLQDLTGLTRRAVCSILTASGRLDDFHTNPQRFIQMAAEIINRCKGRELVDGIKYQRLGAEHYYAQELFRREELVAYLKNTVPAAKSVYDRVIYDSDRERAFAKRLERNSAVKVYAKLPGWFRVPTPLGSYNPDWAVLVEQDGGERLYFVAETKGSLNPDALRPTEAAKIECGKAHFAALQVHNPPAVYKVVSDLDDLLPETPA